VEALERVGDVRGALRCLRENVKCAKERRDECLLWNALGELQAFCLSRAKYAELGLRVTERLLQLADEEKTVAVLRCDRADLLAASGRLAGAEEEYRGLFSDHPGVPFARYRYPLFLYQHGKAAEAEEVLVSLLDPGGGADAETRQAARELLADIGRGSGTG